MRSVTAPTSRRSFVIELLAASLCGSGCQAKQASNEIIVGAATSMRHVFPELTKAFEKEHPEKRIVVTYGASGDVARQVEAGAGVDVVVFAGKMPLDKLVQSKHVDPSTTKIVGTNELVLVGVNERQKLTFATLDALPTGERLAIGDPATVPVGQYAREALEHLGLWGKLEGRIVFGTNVAAVLAYLQRGEVTAAIVYRTEIQRQQGIVIFDIAKGAWAPRPEIWTGVVTESQDRRMAQAFVDFLVSPLAQKTWSSFGFGLP